jgi:hypothetical protein
MAIEKNPKTSKPATTPATASNVAPDTESTGTVTVVGADNDTSAETATLKRGPGAPKGKRGPRGPRGESLAWDKPKVRALILTMRRMESEGALITPMRLATALTELPEFKAQAHLLEDATGSLRVANKVKELQASIEEGQKEGRNITSLPAFSTARGPRLDLASIVEELEGE